MKTAVKKLIYGIAFYFFHNAQGVVWCVNEFLLTDRIQKIRSVINEYGIDNFYVSFSGGKDSCVLDKLIDMAFPENDIPRVYINTGIELETIKNFVMKKAETDERVVIVKPQRNIKETLETYGYPFKSKKHSKKLGTYQRNGYTLTTEKYLNPPKGQESFGCPESLRYQFSEDFKTKVDYQCCVKMKEEPLRKWGKENNKPFSIIGIRKEEGGSRSKAKGCLAFRGKQLKNFQPLIPITDIWISWFVKEYNVKLCELYSEPYNFIRTGCKGCPFNVNLQKELDTLERFFPTERKQCEYIWKPIYEEYRRLGYRLRPSQIKGQLEWNFETGEIIEHHE